jgi:hypothetical protein
LLCLFAAHWNWAERFLADPTLLGVADTYGIEHMHPWREGRSERQIGARGGRTIDGSWASSWPPSPTN